jgi:hypothetical protein
MYVGMDVSSKSFVIHAVDERKRVKMAKEIVPTREGLRRMAEELGRINRDGRHEVRRVLLQCAHTVGRMKTLGSKPLREFYQRIEKRRGKKISSLTLDPQHSTLDPRHSTITHLSPQRETPFSSVMLYSIGMRTPSKRRGFGTVPSHSTYAVQETDGARLNPLR